MSAFIPQQVESSTALGPQQDAAVSWARFPAEVQLMIWECVTEDYLYGTPDEHSPKVAHLAVVCRDWQQFFERVTFRRLRVDAGSLPMLSDVVTGKGVARLGYIRHLWLNLGLKRYSCGDCLKAEESTTVASNNGIFTAAIRELLRILSNWEPCNDGVAGGLTLELSAHSSSDCEHAHHSFMLSDKYPFNCEEDLKKSHQTITSCHRVKRHTFTRFRGSFGQRLRLFGSPLDFHPGGLSNKANEAMRLPPAPVVRGLLIRRQFYRRLSAHALAILFRESLVRAEWLRLERWTDMSAQKEAEFNRDFANVLTPDFPQSLTRFYFTKSSSGEQGIGDQGASSEVIDGRECLEAGLADACYDLKELSVPADVDALGIFRRLMLSPEPPRAANLRRLILQGPSVESGGDWLSVYQALEAAAHAVKCSMPHLRELEIWNFAHLDSSYVFHFKLGDRKPKITWRCSSQHKFVGFPSDLEDVWRDAAAAIAVHPPEFVQEEIEVMSPKDRMKLFRSLKLWKLIFDPITLAQIEAGNDAAWVVGPDLGLS